ncbi:MAG: DegT/DnrJ/EryC1/StrS family aminotransferase [Gemmatimonadota bacterium]
MRVPFMDLEAMHAPLADALQRALLRVVAHGQFVLGPEVDAFEREFADFCGAAHAVGVGNGLDAITLTLRAAGLSHGAEVIVPANTYIATALGVIQAGGIPVPADVLPDSYDLDPVAAEAALTERTEAILPVHLYGQPADMDRLRALADRRGLLLVEDAAQAQGARWRGRRTGSLSHAGCFSFYPAKNLGAFGDAGAVVTDDAALAERLRRLRSYGQREKYVHVSEGVNSRLDSLQAAVLLAKLPHLDGWNDARRRIAERYARELEGAEARLPAEVEGAEHVWHLYVVQVEERARVRAALAERGVETLIHYPAGLADHEAFAARGWRAGDYPVTTAARERVLSLPMFPGLDEVRQEYVAAALREVLAARGAAAVG